MNTEKNATDIYTLSPTLPFMAFDKTNSTYKNIVVTDVSNGKAKVYSTFADGYRKYKRVLNIEDIELIQKHICNPDSFNKHCQICGKYCG